MGENLPSRTVDFYLYIYYNVNIEGEKTLKNTKQKKYLTFAALSDIICVLLVNYAMLDGDISIITILSASSIIISLILSRIILKEKITLSQYIMIILLVIAVLILSLIS